MKTNAAKSPRSRRSTRQQSRSKSARFGAPRVRSNTLPRAVMVLGMHRSGTSALTRVISLLGADLSKNLMQSSTSDEGGYWESKDFMVVHDQILSSSGSKWDDW